MERYHDGKPLACRSCCCVLWWCLPRLEFGEIMFGNAKIVDRTEDCGNGFGWSIVEWEVSAAKLSPLIISDAERYELAVLHDGNICYDSSVTSDVVRGNWTMMEKLKCMITDLEPNHLSS